MEKNNVQSVIEEIASEVDDPEVTDPVVEEQDPNGNPNEGDDPNPNDGDGADNPEDVTDGDKAGQAFAAQRVKIKEQNDLITRLQNEIKTLKGEPEEQPPAEEEKPDILEIKEDDSEAVKLLKQELQNARKDIEELKTDKDTRTENEKKAAMVSEITGLQKKYTLSGDKLMEFATKAEEQGFILGQSELSVEQIYTLVYHDEMMQDAMKKIENDVNEDVAPGPGPTGGVGKTGKQSTSVKGMVSGIIKDMGLS